MSLIPCICYTTYLNSDANSSQQVSFTNGGVTISFTVRLTYRRSQVDGVVHKFECTPPLSNLNDLNVLTRVTSGSTGQTTVCKLGDIVENEKTVMEGWRRALMDEGVQFYFFMWGLGVHTVHLAHVPALPGALNDLTLTCKGGMEIRACKALLALVSPVFHSMFSNADSFKPVSDIALEDYDLETVQKLVQYSISREYTPAKDDHAFIDLCHRYLIDPVVSRWCTFMVDYVDPAHAVETLQLARILAHEPLIRAAASCIRGSGPCVHNLSALDKDDLLSIIMNA